MKAIIKGYGIGDVDDLSTYESGEPLIFGYEIIFSIGIAGKDGADYFTVLVASAGYLQKLFPNDKVRFLQHTILAQDYNVKQVVILMEKYVNSLEEESWARLVDKINLVARWEF